MIPAPYNVHDISGKAVCKQALIDEQGLNPFLANRPILGFIGRLQEQKGIDLLLEIFERIIQRNVGIVVLGEGNLRFEERVLRLMEEYPLRLSANVSYTEDLAHRIQAGSDIFLMPSRYEPCGLTQMYSLRYGTPPVATAVGGLRDTIIPYPHPECTGLHFRRIQRGPVLQCHLPGHRCLGNQQARLATDPVAGHASGFFLAAFRQQIPFALQAARLRSLRLRGRGGCDFQTLFLLQFPRKSLTMI